VDFALNAYTIQHGILFEDVFPLICIFGRRFEDCMDETGLGLCQMVAFGINGIESSP
jgi:hypothetical protein